MTLGASHADSIKCRWPNTTGAKAMISSSVRTHAATSQSRFRTPAGNVGVTASSCTRGRALDTIPLGLRQPERGMGHEQMPDDGRERPRNAFGFLEMCPCE